MEAETGKDGRVPIRRHDEPPKPIEWASYECRYLEDIVKHIAEHIGPTTGNVLHEILSPTVHVDLHVIPPSDKVPYLTLITSGMSDLDMVAPDDVESYEEYKLAEMIAFLPPDWSVESVTGTEGKDEKEPPHWYVARWLKHYARMPHEYQTMLSWFHTTSNGEPASPIEDGIGMVGFLFAPAIHLGTEGLVVKTHDGRDIRLLNIVPIWPDEVVYAINKGGQALCKKLDREENFVFDPTRQSCLKRKKFFGLF